MSGTPQETRADYARSRLPDQGATVYRTDDNGATWTSVETGTQTNYSRIVADPVNPAVFYVMGAMGTLYKSTDAGKNFVKHEARLHTIP